MLEGKKTAMNEEKIAALDSIGFFWVANPNGAGESDVDAAAEPPSLNAAAEPPSLNDGEKHGV